MLNLRLSQFLEDLASEKPTPGGGSASALAGALGAALVAMVCRLTIGRKSYAEVEGQMREILSRAEALRHDLVGLAEEDARAYEAVAAALALPRSSADEKAVRRAVLQRALLGASEVPLRTAEACREVLRLAVPVARRGNRNAVSDAGGAALLAAAGLRGALLNVSINLASLEDPGVKASLEERSRKLAADAASLEAEALAEARTRIG
jgi:formiminotetrahydrofolate cyclodeaminase